MLRTVRSWVVAEQPPISKYVWRPWVEKRTAFPTTTIFGGGYNRYDCMQTAPPNVIFGPTTNPSEHLDPKFWQFSLRNLPLGCSRLSYTPDIPNCLICFVVSVCRVVARWITVCLVLSSDLKGLFKLHLRQCAIYCICFRRFWCTFYRFQWPVDHHLSSFSLSKLLPIIWSKWFAWPFHCSPNIL